MRVARPGPWLLITLLALTQVPAHGEQVTPPPAKPVEAIGAILDAFKDHSLVALSDAHGNKQAHEFLLSLIRHPRFASTVNDIVVEFGTSRYQDVADRFVGGEDIPYATLRKAWQDAVQPSPAHDIPHAEDVFRTVRAVNAALPRDRHIRLVLGDPPIKWEEIRTPADHDKWGPMRDWFAAALIQVEVTREAAPRIDCLWPRPLCAPEPREQLRHDRLARAIDRQPDRALEPNESLFGLA
jgi:hypothetical protein